MCQYSVFYGEYENEKKTGQKKWPSPTWIWTTDFWTSSCPKLEFWARLDQKSSRFLKNLDFNLHYFKRRNMFQGLNYNILKPNNFLTNQFKMPRLIIYSFPRSMIKIPTCRYQLLNGLAWHPVSQRGPSVAFRGAPESMGSIGDPAPCTPHPKRPLITARSTGMGLARPWVADPMLRMGRSGCPPRTQPRLEVTGMATEAMEVTIFHHITQNQCQIWAH